MKTRTYKLTLTQNELDILAQLIDDALQAKDNRFRPLGILGTLEGRLVMLGVTWQYGRNALLKRVQ